MVQGKTTDNLSKVLFKLPFFFLVYKEQLLSRFIGSLHWGMILMIGGHLKANEMSDGRFSPDLNRDTQFWRGNRSKKNLWRTKHISNTITRLQIFHSSVICHQNIKFLVSEITHFPEAQLLLQISNNNKGSLDILIGFFFRILGNKSSTLYNPFSHFCAMCVCVYCPTHIYTIVSTEYVDFSSLYMYINSLSAYVLINKFP